MSDENGRVTAKVNVMLKSVFAIVCFVVLAPLHVNAGDSDAIDYEAAEKYIVECSKDWAESVVTGDKTKRRIYFADDFVGTSTSGGRYDKASVTKESGPAKYIISNTLNNVDVKFYGTTAIAFGDETWTKKDGSSGRYVWTDVWAFRNGEWQIVAAQDAVAAVENN